MWNVYNCEQWEQIMLTVVNVTAVDNKKGPEVSPTHESILDKLGIPRIARNTLI